MKGMMHMGKSRLDIALAGNPNVGKSTVFNALTGLKQHTGNWTGKTVATARGSFKAGEREVILTDLPGTYSVMAHSAEERVARDHICFSGADGVIVVCDGSCLERNLNLVLQITEITPKVLVCVNLLDEAAKKGITVDLEALERELGVPVAGTAARSGRGLDEMLDRLDDMLANENARIPVCSEHIEQAVTVLAQAVEPMLAGRLSARFAAVRILERCADITETIDSNTCGELKKSLSDENSNIGRAYIQAMKILADAGTGSAELRDSAVVSIVQTAEEICGKCVKHEHADSCERDRKIDRIILHPVWGVPILLVLLTLIFYITVSGANYPSMWLAGAFSGLGGILENGLVTLGAPEWLISLLMDGVYGTLSKVASVMLPPMAIFFPLFTLLEDVGYLPRAAFLLDRFFSRGGAGGKQALTMAMGLGCNAAGITGCRIIDSPRERLIAILTNNFMPCNGRFPTLIVLSSIFLSAGMGGALSAIPVTALIVLGAVLTLICSRLLSSTVLKGESSSFALELPSYRAPQIGKVLIRSLCDRTVFVLGRAVTVAAPAGLVIWLMGNVFIGDSTILTHCSRFLEPVGQLFGMDGAIILAFILGAPANEIVLPILLMIYTGSGSPAEYENAVSLSMILGENGWTWVTALCTMIFMLCHFPCTTACLTVKKETGSWKYTLLAMALPTVAGLILCFAVNLAAQLFQALF